MKTLLWGLKMRMLCWNRKLLFFNWHCSELRSLGFALTCAQVKAWMDPNVAHSGNTLGSQLFATCKCWKMWDDRHSTGFLQFRYSVGSTPSLSLALRMVTEDTLYGTRYSSTHVKGRKISIQATIALSFFFLHNIKNGEPKEGVAASSCITSADISVKVLSSAINIKYEPANTGFEKGAWQDKIP